MSEAFNKMISISPKGSNIIASAYFNKTNFLDPQLQEEKALNATRFLSSTPLQNSGIRLPGNEEIPAFGRGIQGQSIYDGFNKIRRKTGKNASMPIIFDIETFGSVDPNSRNMGIVEIAMKYGKGKDQIAHMKMNPFASNQSLKGLYLNAIDHLTSGAALEGEERATLKSLIKYSNTPDLYDKIDDSVNLTQYLSQIKEGYANVQKFGSVKQGLTAFKSSYESITKGTTKTPIMAGFNIKNFDIPAVMNQAKWNGVDISTKNIFKETFDFYELASVINLDRMQGIMDQKGSRTVQNIYRSIMNKVKYVEQHNAVADSIDEWNLAHAILGKKEVIDAVYGLDSRLGAGRLSPGDKLFSTNGLRTLNEKDIILGKNGKPVKAGANSLFKGITYEFKGTYKDGEKFAMVLYSPTRRVNSVIYRDTLEELQGVIHSNFVTKAVADATGYSTKKATGSSLFAHGYQIDSAQREYRRMFEYGKQDILSSIYGTGDKKLTHTQRRMKTLYGQRINSEKDIVTAILNDTTIVPEMRPVAAKIALDELGQHQIDLAYTYGQKAMEIKDIANGKIGLSGDKVSRIQIRTAEEAKSSLYGIVNNANNTVMTGRKDASKHLMANDIIEDLIINNKVDEEGKKRLFGVKDYETVENKLREIADVVTKNFTNGDHLILKDKIESTGERLLGPDRAIKIQSALDTARTIVNGSSIFTNVHSMRKGLWTGLDSFEEYFKSVAINPYTGQKTGIKKGISNIAQSIIESLPSGFSGALIPLLDKNGQINSFDFSIYSSAGGRTTAADIISGRIPEAHVGTIRIPMMAQGIVKSGQMKRIARNVISGDGKNIYSSYELLARDVGRNINIFSGKIANEGIDTGINFLQSVITNSIKGLSASSSYQSSDGLGLDVSFTLADKIKAGAVDVNFMLPTIKDGRIEELNSAVNAGLKKNQIYGIKEKWAAIQDVYKQLQGRFYVTGKDSDVADGILNMFNVQDYSAFGFMNDPSRGNMTQALNYYAIKDKVGPFVAGIERDNVTYTKSLIEGLKETTRAGELDGVSAQGKLSTSEDIARAIDDALKDPNLSKEVREELTQKRFRLGTYENMGIMSQDLAETMGSSYTKRLPLTAEEAKKMENLLSAGKLEKMDINQINKALGTNFTIEDKAKLEFKHLIEDNGKYWANVDVHMDFESGYKAITFGGEKSTFEVFSREAYKAIDHGSGSHYMILPNVGKHGDIGSLIEGSLAYKVRDMRQKNSTRAEIQALIDSLNQAFESNKENKPIVLDKNYNLRIAEDITVGQGNGNKKAWQIIANKLGDNTDSYGVNIFSRVRNAKVDRNFKIQSEDLYGRKGVTFGQQELGALRMAGYDESANWLEKEFLANKLDRVGNRENLTARKLSGVLASHYSMARGVELPDTLQTFSYGAEEATSGKKGLKYTARINGINKVEGIIDYQDTIFMPKGLKDGDFYKLELPTTFKAEEFDDTILKRIENKSMIITGGIGTNELKEIGMVARDLDHYAFDNSRGKKSGFGLGGTDSAERAMYSLESAIGSYKDGNQESRDNLKKAIVNYYKNAADELAGSHTPTTEAFSAHLGNSGRFNARGINPLEMFNQEGLLYKAGLKENTAIISKSAFLEMGGDEKLLQSVGDSGIFNTTEDIFGHAVRYPTLGQESLQGVKLMIASDDLLGNKKTNMFLTPLLMKKLKGDFDGDTISFILATGKNREKMSNEIRTNWTKKYANQTADEIRGMYAESIAKKYEGTAANMLSLRSLLSSDEAIEKANNAITRSFEGILESKMGTKMFTGYANNMSREVQNLAEFYYGRGEEYDLIEKYITRPVVQEGAISSKHFKSAGGAYNALFLVDEVFTGTADEGKISDFKKIIMGYLGDDADSEKVDEAFVKLTEMQKAHIGQKSAHIGLSSSPEKSYRALDDIVYGRARTDVNFNRILKDISFLDQAGYGDLGASYLKNKSIDAQNQVIGEALENTFKQTNSSKFNFKITGKTAMVATGVAAGLFAFNAVRGAIDIGSARIQGKPDEAPGADGYYIPGGAENMQSPTARVLEAGAGYEGMQINIKAYNRNRTDVSDLNGRLSESIAGGMTVPVKINTHTTDDRSSMNRDQIQQIIADTIRG